MIPSSKKEAKKNSQEPDSDSVTIIKISVQSTDNKKVEKKSNEETTDLVGEESRDEEHKHQTHPDAACAAGNQIQNEGRFNKIDQYSLTQISDNSVTKTIFPIASRKRLPARLICWYIPECIFI